MRWDGTFGRLDVVDDSRRQVQVWDLPAGKQRQKFLSPPAPDCPVAVTPDGTGVVAESDPYIVVLRDVATGEVRHAAKLAEFRAQSVAVRPDGRLVAVVDPYGRITLWEPATGRTYRLETTITTPEAAAFSPDGKQLAIADYQAGAVLIDVATGKAVREFRSQGGGSLAFSPDGKALAVARYDEVRLWDTASGKLVHTLDGRAGRVHTVAFGPGGKWVASGHPSRVILWDAASGKVLGSKDTPERDVSAKCLAVSPDGKVLAVGDEAGTIRLWGTAELLGAEGRK